MNTDKPVPPDDSPESDDYLDKEDVPPVRRGRAKWYVAFGILFLLTAAVLVYLNLPGSGFDLASPVGWFGQPPAKANLVEIVLREAYNLRSPKGLPFQSDPEAENDTVYVGGVRVYFLLMHDKRGDEPITVNQMSLKLEKFTPGENAAIRNTKKWFPNEAEYAPSGPSPQRRFTVKVRGNTIEPATWSHEQEEPPFTTARSANFLDTPEPFVYRVVNNQNNQEERTQTVEGQILPLEPGYYVMRLYLDYTVGSEAKQYRSRAIRLYWEGK